MNNGTVCLFHQFIQQPKQRYIFKRLISPYHAFRSRTSGPPFSTGKVKLRPNELSRRCAVHAKDCGEIEVSEQVRKALHTGPGCSVGRHQSGE